MKNLLIAVLALGVSSQAFAICTVLVKKGVSDSIKVALIELNYDLVSSPDEAEINYIVSQKRDYSRVNYFGIADWQGGYNRYVQEISFEKVIDSSNGSLLRKPIIKVKAARMRDADHWASGIPLSFGDEQKKSIRRFLRKLKNNVGPCK